jgi:uncharacterized protein
MKKTELLSMLVAELNTLAKKMKVAVPVRAKKSEIVALLLSAVAPRKKSPAKKAVVKKAATKKAATRKAAPKKSSTPRKAATRKAANSKRETAVQNKVAPLHAPVRKRGERIITPVHDWKQPPREEEPLLAQERVAESKFYTGAVQQPAVAELGELPKAYGQDRIVLMTRDPFVVHAYWEATPARLEHEKAWFGWGSKLHIRIYDITGVQFDGRNAIGYYDQEVVERMGNWYFDLGRPSHSFCADVGLLSTDGRFLTLARSNYVTMPRDGVSDVIDEEWMLVDEEFWKLYGYPDGLRGVSSPEMQEAMRRRRLQEVTSPGLFSRERVKTKRK